MTYVISGIDGFSDKLTEMLDLIRFSDRDVLYVLGDAVGIGPGSLDVLNDLSMRANVYPIAGEKDFRALRMLSGFDRMAKDGTAPDAAFIAEMTAWAENEGGQTMLADFRALDDEMREGVLDFLSEMTLYEQAETGSRKYLLVHAGVRGFDASRDLDSYEPDDFMSVSPDFRTPYFSDCTVIVGHTPTSRIPGAVPGKIYRTDGFIAIDCGAAEGGTLSCLRLEDGEEFYV